MACAVWPLGAMACEPIAYWLYGLCHMAYWLYDVVSCLLVLCHTACWRWPYGVLALWHTSTLRVGPMARWHIACWPYSVVAYGAIWPYARWRVGPMACCPMGYSPYSVVAYGVLALWHTSTLCVGPEAWWHMACWPYSVVAYGVLAMWAVGPMPCALCPMAWRPMAL